MLKNGRDTVAAFLFREMFSTLNTVVICKAVMIEHFWHHNHDILEIRPIAELSPAEFRALAAQVDPIICEHGTLHGLLIDAGHFNGWKNFTYQISSCVFCRDQHRQVHRIAVLSDHMLIGFMPQLLNHFVAAEARPFPRNESYRALAWLLESG
ncbi:STAS/SEC14 domain-containing protein [Microbulbifer sp.]|uniref:STAS/SEC14 domain-containing protein n=1 Tax=Microbulbifer sp. TaxID=1908541 RepID=UPI00258D645D|nr:STAS/SEC14 domain-containing protein [Microbulbifer sp.]